MIRRILEIPDPLLREVAQPIKSVEPPLGRLIADMYATMHAHDGLGLAAPQVGVTLRVVVIQLPHDDEDPQSGIPYTLINPEIIESGPREQMTEGCLSLPGYRATVERATSVIADYRQPNGRPATLDARGLLAQAVQHEIDHLDGVLFTDHLDTLLDLQQILPEPLDWTRDEVEEAYELAG